MQLGRFNARGYGQRRTEVEVASLQGTAACSLCRFQAVTLLPSLRAFVVWLANGDTIRVFKMTKKEDGSFAYVAAPEDFPKQHKAPVINIGVADTGIPPGSLHFSAAGDGGARPLRDAFL